MKRPLCSGATVVLLPVLGASLAASWSAQAARRQSGQEPFMAPTVRSMLVVGYPFGSGSEQNRTRYLELCNQEVERIASQARSLGQTARVQSPCSVQQGAVVNATLDVSGPASAFYPSSR